MHTTQCPSFRWNFQLGSFCGPQTVDTQRVHQFHASVHPTKSLQHSDPYCRPLADRPAFTSNGIHIFVVSSASIRCEMFDWHLTLPCNGGFTSPRLTMSLSATLRLLNSSLIYSLPVCLYFGSLCFLPHTAANVVQ